MLRNPRLSACLEIASQCTLVDVLTACYSRQDVCTLSDWSESVVKSRSVINMSTSPQFAQDSLATSQSSQL